MEVRCKYQTLYKFNRKKGKDIYSYKYTTIHIFIKVEFPPRIRPEKNNGRVLFKNIEVIKNKDWLKKRTVPDKKKLEKDNTTTCDHGLDPKPEKTFFFCLKAH